MASLKSALYYFYRLGISHPLITLGKDGAVGFNGKDTVHVHHKPIHAVNDVGCGDAFVAGFLKGHLVKRPFVDNLRLGVAAGTCCAGHMAPGVVINEEVERLYKKVSIKYL